MPPPLFFFSYARADADPHLDRLFDDLSREITTKLGGRAAPTPGFRDSMTIPLGSRWSTEPSPTTSEPGRPCASASIAASR